MFAPRDQRYRDLVVARKSFNDGRCYLRAECFLPETMQDFKRLLLLVINTEVRVNNLKKSLKERKNFDIVKAYVACGGTEDDKSRLKPANFQKFLI